MSFVLNLASVMILARLLTPADYGLVAMVTALTGILAMLKDAGLSMATIQRDSVTHEQVSTLFWINVALSLVLMLVIAALAPAIAWFYGEPKLQTITLAIACIFVCSGLTVQHQALLRRQMRFGVLARIQVTTVALALIVAIVSAMMGIGYWVLIMQMAVLEIAGLALTWGYCRWVPGRPQRGVGVRSMLKFGGYLTGFSFVNYFGRNTDNILIGNVWGDSALGLYSKAYTLLVLPLGQINWPISAVATPALSRLQDSPEAFRDLFRKVLGVVAFLAFPLIAWMIICREEIVLLILGPQWQEAVPIYTILAVSAFFQPIANISGLLYVTLGRTRELFIWGLIGNAWIVLAFVIGLPYGPMGVASAYSIAVAVMMLPLMMFSVSGTFLKLRDYYDGVKYPAITAIISGIVGGIVYQLISNYEFRFLNLASVFVAMGIVHISVSMKLSPSLLRYATEIIVRRH